LRTANTLLNGHSTIDANMAPSTILRALNKMKSPLPRSLGRAGVAGEGAGLG